MGNGHVTSSVSTHFRYGVHLLVIVLVLGQLTVAVLVLGSSNKAVLVASVLLTQLVGVVVSKIRPKRWWLAEALSYIAWFSTLMSAGRAQVSLLLLVPVLAIWIIGSPRAVAKVRQAGGLK